LLRKVRGTRQTLIVTRARRHPRVASFAAFLLLALVAELLGRSLTHRIDVGRHIASPSYSGADYYPFLLLAVKLGIALLLARLLWRFVKAHATEGAARGMLGRLPSERRPRLRMSLSPRLWAAAFVLTSALSLVQSDAERLSSGHGALFAPLLHTSALSIFAVLSVLVALLWGAVAGWLSAYESYAEAALARAYRLVRREAATPRPRLPRTRPVRQLFGLAFVSRPPPLAA
jgi:hypothetical protein